MSRSARAAKGFAASIVQYCTQILVQILLAPIVLKVAGRETLGAYAAIMQTLAFLGFVDIAGSWSLERFLAQASGLEDNGARFRNVFTTSRTILLVTNSLFAALVVIFSFFVPRLFHLSPAVGLEAKHALYVIAVWAVVRTPLVAYSNASLATQDIAATNLIGAFAGVLRTVASLGFVLAGAGLFGLMLSGTVAEGVGNLLFRYRYRKLNPTRIPGWGIPDKALLREMLGFGGHAAFLNLGNLLYFSSGNMLAGLTNGAAAASSFYTTQMPTMTVYNMIYRMAEAATPAINELYGREDHERVRQAFIRLYRLMMLLNLPLAVCVLIFNRDLVITWVGTQQYAGLLLTASLAAFCLVNAIQRLVVLFAVIFGWIRLLSLTTILQGIANFGLAFYLGRKMGLGGITLALVIILLPQVFILIQRISRYLGLNIAGLLAKTILRSLVPLAAAASLGLLVHAHVVIARRHFVGLLAELGVFAIVYALLAWFFLM
ncbi:MAG TPA: MATE family efflux transporter, partial [Silvibacterium sp.]|nr:MATE family efflux transporter [Silvibacterium sp.]